MFVILQTFYKTVSPEVLWELRRAHVGPHLYGQYQDLCSGNFGVCKVVKAREGRQGKGRAARQGKGRTAREGRQGKGSAARQGMGGYIA
jgi:hypothetical protein